ncbi:PMT family glycosyltransferase, 4-amino-4-deoxy-L-arabinose transferase [Pseudomonas asplenii]|uniref:PMT family glycosyltransferase, 4-amino-4-deoxy-L-arabinose transferase n=2 Tax=Pseudomonas asplenii TaxID=53407 RepID=A0A0M9GD81_9PSED|nr:PMT family glycosyltransferase, 4-amino-4-deoxy-L-arabinose transferase [Pseudomonas fuscovaginae]
MDALTGRVMKKPCLSIFLLSLMVFMGLQYKPAILNYTTRFVDFAEYMLYHGVTLFPIADDLKPYPDYTIANTLLMYLVSLPFGRVSVLSMGLPYCITAALILVFIYKLGALHDRKWGLYGALFSLFTWSFLDSVNSLALDVYPALFTLICFYLVYRGDVKQDPSRLPLVFLGLALGFAFRGPIGLIGPSIVVGCYYLLSRQWRALGLFSLLSGLILVAAVALLSWAAYVQGGMDFLHDVLMMQGLDRLAGGHAPRYYFYFSSGLVTYGVTVFFTLYVVARKYKTFFRAPGKSDTALLFYLAAWFMALILFFTIPNAKKARYILSITPAISLLAAYIFVDRSGLFEGAKNGLLRFCLRLPWIGLGLVAFVFAYNFFAVHPLLPNYPAVLGSLAVLLVARHLLGKHCAEHRHRELIILAFGVATFLALDAFFFNSITYHLELANEPTPKFLPYWFW